MANFIEEFYYVNLDPQARSTKQNKVVNGESNLDSFIMGFRLGANFAYDTFVSEDSPFTDLLKEAYLNQKQEHIKDEMKMSPMQYKKQIKGAQC